MNIFKIKTFLLSLLLFFQTLQASAALELISPCCKRALSYHLIMPPMAPTRPQLTTVTKTHSFEGSFCTNISAKIDMPSQEKDVLGFGILTHPFGGTKEYFGVRHLSKKLAESGICAMRFDFTGLGKSAGRFEDTSLTSQIEDVRKAANEMKRIFQAPDMIIGHSFGGTAAMHASACVPNLKIVSAINSPYLPTHISHAYKDKLFEIKTKGKAKIKLGKSLIDIGYPFIKDLHEKHNETHFFFQHSTAQLVLFHSSDDDIVSVDNAFQLREHAISPCTLRLLTGGHLLLNKDEINFISVFLTQRLLNDKMEIWKAL